MNVNLRKLLTAASCWLVILCGSHDRVEGAGQTATVDGILRSVVAVRTQLEPVAKNRLAQRTTPYPQMAGMRGLSCSGARNVPGLQRLFNCVTPDQIGMQPAAPVSAPPPFTAEARVNDKPQKKPSVEIIVSDQRATWSTYSDGTSASIQSGSSPPYQGDRVRANPLGLIIPTQEQLNQFQQWQRPYQRPIKPVTTTTTARPPVDKIYFPQSVDDRVTAFGTVRPTKYYTTTAPVTVPTRDSIAERLPWETSTWAGVDSTKDSYLEAEVTTEPTEEEEHGLGNRIDHKLLLSLVG